MKPGTRLCTLVQYAVYLSFCNPSFKKFIEEGTVSDTLSKEEYTELCTEIGSKEEVGTKYIIGRLELMGNGLYSTLFPGRT